jgi:hypothetical protein
MVGEGGIGGGGGALPLFYTHDNRESTHSERGTGEGDSQPPLSLTSDVVRMNGRCCCGCGCGAVLLTLLLRASSSFLKSDVLSEDKSTGGEDEDERAK